LHGAVGRAAWPVASASFHTNVIADVRLGVTMTALYTLVGMGLVIAFM
jgi:hypothetical protein